MNATFNLKRFFLLERYKKRETCKHLLWSTAIILGICLLCVMYDINRGGNFMEHTQAGAFSRYILWFLCIAPCLLEASIVKHNSTLYLLLPASAFEKFLHIWLKYILVLPLFCGVLLMCLKGVFLVSGIGYLEHFGASIEPYAVRKDQMLTISLLQGIFFLGCFTFKRQMLVKSFGVFCLYILGCFGVIALLSSLLLPPDGYGEYWMNNMIAFPSYNFPVSAAAEAVITFCNYAAPLLLIIGTWVSAYFLLKEKQL